MYQTACYQILSCVLHIRWYDMVPAIITDLQMIALTHSVQSPLCLCVCVRLLNVYSKTTETASKTETSPFISVHLQSSYFSTPGENRLLRTHKGATSCWPQPEQSKRSILMIPDKIVRRYPPGCDDTLHYSRQIDREDDERPLQREKAGEPAEHGSGSSWFHNERVWPRRTRVDVSLRHTRANWLNCFKISTFAHRRSLSERPVQSALCVWTWCTCEHSKCLCRLSACAVIKQLTAASKNL